MEKKIKIEQISLTIRKFLFDNYLFGYAENELGNDTSFLEFGVLDSFGILELIKFIESEFHIEVEDAEILPENLDTVERVSHFIKMKSS